MQKKTNMICLGFIVVYMVYVIGVVPQKMDVLVFIMFMCLKA